MEPKEEVLHLTQVLNEANYRYYVLDDPSMPDFEYDRLLRRLEELEAAHPELLAPDSPTQRVGGQAISQFEKVEHPVPLESLQDVFSLAELAEFHDRVRQIIVVRPIGIAAPKLSEGRRRKTAPILDSGPLRRFDTLSQLLRRLPHFAAMGRGDRSDQDQHAEDRCPALEGGNDQRPEQRPFRFESVRGIFGRPVVFQVIVFRGKLRFLLQTVILRISGVFRISPIFGFLWSIVSHGSLRSSFRQSSL